MKTERETTRIVRSWLEIGADRLPDRVLDSVLEQLPTHRQRRRPPWWPGRFSPMNSYAKIAIAAAAVLVVAVLGYSVLPRASTGVGPPVPTPSPTATLPPLPSGSVAPGSYRFFDTRLTLLPYTVTVPAGWTAGDGYISTGGDIWRGTGVTLTTWIVSHFYGDSCHWTDTLQPVTGAAQLAAGLAAQGTHESTNPTSTTIGGIRGTHVTLSLDSGFDVASCDGATALVRLWPDPGPDETGGWPIFPGQSTDVYAIDANGQVMVVMTVRHADSAADDVTQLQSILESLRFEP